METQSPVSEKLAPEEFVRQLLEEVKRLCGEALEYKTGSTLQRGIFQEIEECAGVLCNPDSLEGLRNETCNGFLYNKLKPIDWEAPAK